MAELREIDLVLFEAHGCRFAADAWDVRRIDRPHADRPGVELAPLGGRSLVIDSGEGEAQVRIDRLLGFERVEAEALRSLPPFASGLADPAVVGAWLKGPDIVLLIDLPALMKGAAGSTVPEDSHARNE